MATALIIHVLFPSILKNYDGDMTCDNEDKNITSFIILIFCKFIKQ